MTTKTVFRRQVIRAAVRIHEHLLGPARHGQGLALPQSAWEDLCRTVKHLRYTERKGWHSASQSLIQDVDYGALRFQREMEILRQSLLSRSTPKSVASASEIASELFALEEEFAEVQLELKEHTVSVLTTGIELEGVHLGPFRIVLAWERIGQPRSYRCYAQEPYHPQDREDVTHPHVLDHQLCEGEGATSIKAALSAGRLSDFFILVRQILGTYNPESAHVSLTDWNGSISCAGCGTSMSEDEYSTCEQCDERVCNDCLWTCNGCSCSICSSCSSSCSKCDERFCQSCLTTPEGATRLLCDTCLETQKKEASDDTNDDVPAEQPANPPPAALERPPLRLTPYAWAKLLHLRDLGETEVGGFGVSRPEDLLLVEDVHLVRQECTPVTVKFDDQSVADYFDAQVDHGRTPEQFARVWIHTHPGDSPYPSHTDEETFARCFGSADWAVMFIVARGGQAYARLRFGSGPGGDFVLPVEIDFQTTFSAADPAAWETEYRQMVSAELERPRNPPIFKPFDGTSPWADDYSLGNAWFESLPSDLYPDLPLELCDAQFR